LKALACGWTHPHPHQGFKTFCLYRVFQKFWKKKKWKKHQYCSAFGTRNRNIVEYIKTTQLIIYMLAEKLD
jgi:hypothetical protein